MNAQTTVTGPATIVGIQHNTLNLSIFQVTPLEDGMELVEYLGAAGYNVPKEAEDMVMTAKTMATVTGSTVGRNRWETRTADGELVTTAQAVWYRNRYQAPRLVMGVHRAQVALSPEQEALKAEAASQGEPVKGQRYVVSELTGYQLIQDRPMDHRECSCGNGTTTYAAGTVEAITHWMDNSVDATVVLESGRKVTVQMKAPSGDACY